jgi:hypothetical protein
MYYGHLVIIPVLVYCHKKNMSTLVSASETEDHRLEFPRDVLGFYIAMLLYMHQTSNIVYCYVCTMFTERKTSDKKMFSFWAWSLIRNIKTNCSLCETPSCN